MAASKPKTARAIHANRGVEARYRKRLDALLSEMSDSVSYWLEAAYKANPPRLAQDALPSEVLRKRIKELSKRWIGKFDEMAGRIADQFVTSGRKSSDVAFMSALRDSGWAVEFKMTPAMRDAANAAIAENVALIRSIPQQYLLEVEGIILRGYTSGRDLNTISDELQKRYGVTRRRAATIARDQSNKLNATVTRARRLELGLSRAIWQHSGGGKEPRPDHVAANGKEFDIDKGCYVSGEYILPGELINCRCTSRTILPF